MTDRMFLLTPPAVAVRNRRKILANEAVRADLEAATAQVKVLCFAQAAEIFDAYARIPDKNPLHVSLLDIDIQALAHVDKLRMTHRLILPLSGLNSYPRRPVVGLDKPLEC